MHQNSESSYVLGEEVSVQLILFSSFGLPVFL